MSHRYRMGIILVICMASCDGGEGSYQGPPTDPMADPLAGCTLFAPDVLLETNQSTQVATWHGTNPDIRWTSYIFDAGPGSFQTMAFGLLHGWQVMGGPIAGQCQWVYLKDETGCPSGEVGYPVYTPVGTRTAGGTSRPGVKRVVFSGTPPENPAPVAVTVMKKCKPRM